MSAPASQLVVTLGEGNTPLVESVTCAQLFFKLENYNPTGSYKDRFIATQMTRMLRLGSKACVATSAGNTGSALAAYCARYRVRCAILVNHDTPAVKLAQMQAHGARVIRIPEFANNPAVTLSVFETLRAFSRERQVPLVLSAFRYCPEGMLGVQQISREIAARITPDHVFVPVGGGGLYSAVVQGFQEGEGPVPRVHTVQPEGCLTVVASFLRGDNVIRAVNSTTAIGALSVPFDIDGSRALARLRECDGRGIAVSDYEIFAAQRRLLEQEGIDCEPAGAAALAGWLRARQEGLVADGETSVCLVTGHAFKDPASVETAARKHPDVTVSAPQVGGILDGLLTRREA